MEDVIIIKPKVKTKFVFSSRGCMTVYQPPIYKGTLFDNFDRNYDLFEYKIQNNGMFKANRVLHSLFDLCIITSLKNITNTPKRGFENYFLTRSLFHENKFNFIIKAYQIRETKVPIKGTYLFTNQ